MTPIYLRFESEAEAASILPMPEEGLPWWAARDDVGTIHQPTGVTLNVGGVDVPQTAALPGWHVNLLIVGELPTELQPFAVTPETPARRWAGF